MEARQQEYERIYDRFAPLGSTLNRLEREIDVAESEYLENLHSFNQARLHKYSMMMSSNIKVIDAPYYPIKPEKSKRMMMVILAFMVGAFLPAAVIVGMELLDGTMKRPERACEQTGLKLGGVLPRIKRSQINEINFDGLNKHALNHLIQELRAEVKGENRTKKIILFSTQYGEGKSHILEHLNKHFPSVTAGENPEFKFLELGPIIFKPYKEEVVTDADVHILVARANRKWASSDKHSLKVYKKLTGKKPILFLNAVTTEVMEEIVGDIPKKRSRLRTLVKHFLTQGFKPATI